MTSRWLLLLALAGCHRSTEGGVHLEQACAALEHAGAKTSELRTVDPGKLSAQRCMGGLAAGVDAIVCEYGSEEAVIRGKKSAEAWVGGAVTGLALSNGRTVLGLADRTRADPKGKALHDLSQAFLAAK